MTAMTTDSAATALSVATTLAVMCTASVTLICNLVPRALSYLRENRGNEVD